ncbi:DUF2913 family protein [Enterobacter hormaechei]|mgnify:CR=1 FL=1|uniref:DUF2913 family protein n=1 Tax=Enterobacter hormaechei TaxID=158836 RepID=UPI0039C1F328
MNTQEALYSASLSCLLYIREQTKTIGTTPDRKMLNRLAESWVAAAERRRLYPRQCILVLKQQLKSVRHFKNVSAQTILDMLIESKGVIHDVTLSHLMDLSRLRDALHSSSWNVTFGKAQAWQRIPLDRKNICFCLQSDVEARFNELGTLTQPLPMLVAGDADSFIQFASQHAFHVDVEGSEVVDGVLVHRYLLSAARSEEVACV